MTQVKGGWGPYPATVLRHHDGDTFWAHFVFEQVLPFHMKTRTDAEIKIRVKGINAPEKATEQGAIALLVAGSVLPVGTIVDIETFRITHDRYEGVVTLRDRRDYATVLVEHGVAAWMKGYPK
jgi:endonuclease YncB( thermonuclease family)